MNPFDWTACKYEYRPMRFSTDTVRVDAARLLALLQEGAQLERWAVSRWWIP